MSTRDHARALGSLFLLLLSCSPMGKAEPVIAASLPPLASLTRYLVADRFPVVSLLPPGRSEHDYEPTPAEIDRARGSLLFVHVHPDIDGWMLRSAKGVMGEDAPVLSMAEAPIATGRDPHLWLDLDVVRAFIPLLAQRLGALDPEDASLYAARSEALLDSLDVFEAESKALLSGSSGTPFALLHPAFEPFCRRFGLNLVGILERHSEGEALPRSLAEAAIRLRATGARVIFVEPQLPSRSADALAADLGATLANLDPLGGERAPGRETYLGLLRWNVQQLVDHLQ